MESGVDVIFSVFDDLKGSVVLYSSIDSPGVSQNIAVKSFIAIGAMEQDQDLSSRHAVLLLPDVKKIAFFYMFRVSTVEPAESSTTWATISYMHNSSSSENFYKSLPTLQDSIVRVVTIIQKNFSYSESETKLDSAVVESINALRTGAPVKEMIAVPEEVKKAKEAVPETVEEGDLGFLFEHFPKDIGKLVYSLMLEEPVLIISDTRDVVQKVISSVALLVPHRFLSSEYALNYIDPKGKDIVICSSSASFLKKYKGMTTVDVDGRKITSKTKGVPSIDGLISIVQSAPKWSQASFIHKYIDGLLAKAAELIELCEREQVGREDIRAFRENLKTDELNIVISMVKGYAPQFESKLFHFARFIL
ncbi:MAG: hypothetical protein ACFFD4_14055 [Candidatus Odinarchaeota archaeon]